MSRLFLSVTQSKSFLHRMEIVKIKNNERDLKILTSFVENIGEAGKKFRYFEKRSLDVIQNHVTTLLMMNEQKPVGYGHLNKDRDKIWLGIAITPNSQGKGIGRLLMDALISEAKSNHISEILLTVDKDNATAQNLYEKFKFVKIESSENVSFYKYILILNND